MSSSFPTAIPWSTRLTVSVAPSPATLTGDKIHLPQSALEQLLAAASQAPAPLPDPNDPWAKPPPAHENFLPHPLIIKITHRKTDVSAFAVPREFSAEEGEVVLSQFLRKTLGLGGVEDGGVVDVEAASLPKGSKVRLRPLEAGYDDEDWKPILERYMSERFATISEGMILEVPRGVEKSKVWRFLVDRALPDGAVCVVDTDLEVDVEPLDEEQARETLKRQLQKKSSGGVAPGDEHFYELDVWDHALPLEIELDGIDLQEEEDVDLFITTDRQHHKPRLEEHIWGDISSVFPKRIQIFPGNIELVDAKTLHVGVRGWKDPDAGNSTEASTRYYTLFITQTNISSASSRIEAIASDRPSADHQRCKNCTQWIPSRTMILHESFCFRNNIYCSHCNTVFKRGTEQNHWHCGLCSAHGNHPSSHKKHIHTTHTSHACPHCTYIATSLTDLASHRTSICPAKIILCNFCHLLVPQEGDQIPDAEQILSGLTRHELRCGGRTTECNICSRRTRLRDLALHLKTHELQRLSKPLPEICANPLCCRSPADNPLHICAVCFGPLYASTYDPTGSQLQNRVERKLLRQLLVGCGKSWCKSSLSLPLVKVRQQLLLCVDEVTSKRRELAERLSVETVLDEGGRGGYPVEFCVKAVEAVEGDVDRARKWLEREGVRTGER
ncbi:hypothetical protein BDD12DRAFT_988415 [Trichophaea hybrida]|nr:hypothetical protein BDD12DRAFT_988415 [Trichophaea hybrida]